MHIIYGLGPAEMRRYVCIHVCVCEWVQGFQRSRRSPWHSRVYLTVLCLGGWACELYECSAALTVLPELPQPPPPPLLVLYMYIYICVHTCIDYIYIYICKRTLEDLCGRLAAVDNFSSSSHYIYNYERIMIYKYKRIIIYNYKKLCGNISSSSSSCV